jgi:hypothetical protein
LSKGIHVKQNSKIIAHVIDGILLTGKLEQRAPQECSSAHTKHERVLARPKAAAQGGGPGGQRG